MRSEIDAQWSEVIVRPGRRIQVGAPKHHTHPLPCEIFNQILNLLRPQVIRSGKK